MGKNPPAIRRPGFHPCVPKIPWRRKWKPLQYSCLEKNFMDRGTWGQLQPMGWQRVRPNSATNTFPRKNLLPQPCPNQPPRISVNPPALLQKQHKTNVHSRRKTGGTSSGEARRQSTLKDALKEPERRAGSSAPFSGPQLGALSAAGSLVLHAHVTHVASSRNSHVHKTLPELSARVLDALVLQTPKTTCGVATAIILILHETVCGKSKATELRGGAVQPGS